MSKAVSTLALSVALVAGTAGSCQSPQPAAPPVVEVESCDDWEDIVSRDEECGFSDKARPKSPAVKAPPAQPPPVKPQPVKPPAGKTTKR